MNTFAIRIIDNVKVYVLPGFGCAQAIQAPYHTILPSAAGPGDI
jgi:hypothetical protein